MKVVEEIKVEFVDEIRVVIEWCVLGVWDWVLICGGFGVLSIFVMVENGICIINVMENGCKYKIKGGLDGVEVIYVKIYGFDDLE